MRPAAVAISSIALMTILPAVLFAQAAAAQEQGDGLSFQNTSSYVDETRIMHVLGEVKNNSGTAAKQVVITGSFYDSAGSLLGQFNATARLRVVNPGQSAPFDVRYIDPPTVSRVANYTLAVSSQQPADEKPSSMTILSSRSRLDVLGVYFIDVEARNDGEQAATTPTVVATLYDASGRVVAIGEAPAERDDRVVTALPPGQDAGFSVVVAERLQTYKAARYSLVADSDQYLSQVVTLKAAGLGAQQQQQQAPPTNGGTQNSDNRSGCLIATAAFGSELAPQVQALRDFRDGVALKTAAGSSFMTVFNSWYYSFSPQVAEYERGEPWFQSAVRASIQPLLEILELSTATFDFLSPAGGEAAILGAGIVASSLIGLIYLAPVSAAAAAVATAATTAKKNKTATSDSKSPSRRMVIIRYLLLAAWIAGLAAIAAGQLAANNNAGEPPLPTAVMMMFGTAIVVLAAISTVTIAAAKLASAIAARW